MTAEGQGDWLSPALPGTREKAALARPSGPLSSGDPGAPGGARIEVLQSEGDLLIGRAVASHPWALPEGVISPERKKAAPAEAGRPFHSWMPLKMRESRHPRQQRETKDLTGFALTRTLSTTSAVWSITRISPPPVCADALPPPL